MARVRRGVAVRLLYMMTLAAMTCLVVVMYEGTLNMSGTWMFGAGILGLIIECIVTNKMTQGFDWKWLVHCLYTDYCSLPPPLLSLLLLSLFSSPSSPLPLLLSLPSPLLLSPSSLPLHVFKYIGSWLSVSSTS